MIKFKPQTEAREHVITDYHGRKWKLLSNLPLQAVEQYFIAGSDRFLELEKLKLHQRCGGHFSVLRTHCGNHNSFVGVRRWTVKPLNR
jgi:hypothetical protein